MTLDYERLRKRVHELSERSNPALDDAAIERLLRERGARLAARRLEDEAPDVFATVIVARRRDTVLAVPIECVRELRSVKVARLPHATTSLCGIFQLRGQLFSLVDLVELVGAGEPVPHGAQALTAVVEHHGKTLGVRIDEVIGPRVVFADELDRAHRERAIDFVQEVTRDCVQILDVPAVFTCKDFTMGERS